MKISKECNHCNTVYKVKPSLSSKSKYCSKKCKDENLMKGVVRECLHCSKDFYVPMGQIKAGFGKYCSLKCSSTHNVNCCYDWTGEHRRKLSDRNTGKFGISFYTVWKRRYSEQEYNDKVSRVQWKRSKSEKYYEEWLARIVDKDFKVYRKEVTKATNKNNLKELYGYSRRGLSNKADNGVFQLDHIVTVKYGFDHGISPELIGSKENIRFVHWRVNLRKRDSITTDDNYDTQQNTRSFDLLNKWVGLPKLNRI